MTAANKRNIEKKNIEALCAAKGMRMTEQRRVIARVLASVILGSARPNKLLMKPIIDGPIAQRPAGGRRADEGTKVWEVCRCLPLRRRGARPN